MKLIITFIILLGSTIVVSQNTISGTVTDAEKNAIEGANIYIEGTYDGASSNSEGTFSFSTSEKGIKTLIVSFVSFETYRVTTNISAMNNLTIRLKEDENTLDAVVINTGSFEAGSNAKSATLKPMDIVTTAGAMGDSFGAFQTLPGTSKNENDGRLFVRGGDADETQIFIDGMKVFNPFLSTGTGRNLPTRGRFSPFLFKGMNFSTGGYAAEYGQALSGILAMNTTDKPIQEKTDLSFMTVGLGVGNTQIWNKNSFSINASYINLAPYQWALPDKNNWIKPYEGISGEMVYRHEFNKDGLLKLYSSFGVSNLALIQEDINTPNGFHFGIKNKNLYFNGSYKQPLENSWTLFTGLSYGNDNANIKLQKDLVENIENSAHFKLKFKKRFSNFFKLNFGTEYFFTKFDEKFKGVLKGSHTYNFNHNVFGSFAEATILLNNNIGAKVGIRAEKSGLLNQFTLTPRTSLAYKTGKNTQFSLGYGQFYQNPKKQYLKFNQQLSAEKSEHFIANFQYKKNEKTLRIEGYYKKYDQLIKYDGYASLLTTFSNTGYGYAKGLDVFWKDTKSIKYFDYWLSYSFLDTKRNYKNYPIKSRPNFSSKHNLSLVGKYWINNWKTIVGLTYNFASGRTYTNPNLGGFLNQKTKNYNSVSVNASYLITQQKILHFSVNNVLGTKNVYGYRYKNQPNSNGVYESQTITPSADRFFLIGFFWTISNDRKSNQLDNL